MNANEPVAVYVPEPLRHDEWKRRFHIKWTNEEPIGIANLYSEEFVFQLQAEIEALKKEAALQRLFDFTQEAENEPVAWIDPRELNMEVSTTVTKNKWDKDDIPLYTHPADESFDRTASHMAGEYVSYPAKTLTDKLEKLLCSILGEYYVGGEAEEALAEEIRAILRKAQEK